MTITTMRASVSSETLSKAQRLFNHTVDDIINETFQNARRAGATRIDVTFDETVRPAILRITDDGRGIKDPRDFVTLGKSNWSSEVMAEDPAGMGAFSLSSRTSTITSRTAKQSKAWRATITPEGWAGKTEIEIERVDAPKGTTIEIEMPSDWRYSHATAVKNAARYCPVKVTLDGTDCQQENWLANAIYTKAGPGYLIGVHKGHAYDVPNINFHGLTIKSRLPTISEIHGPTYFVRVEMQHAAGLELVLPARKEIIQNEAYNDLYKEANRAILEAIAQKPSHTLPFRDWNLAQMLGIEMKLGTPLLFNWTAPTAESRSVYMGEIIQYDDNLAIMPDVDPDTAVPMQHAIAGTPIAKRLVTAERDFEGYPWYDDLGTVENIVFRVEAGDRCFLREEDDYESLVDGPTKADRITLEFEIVKGDEAECISAPAAAALFSPTYEIDDPEDAKFAWSAESKITASEMADLLEMAYFNPSQDSGADSYETQREGFTLDALRHTVNHMDGAEAAACVHLQRAVRRALWAIPSKERYVITVHNGEVTVTRDPEAAT